MRFTLEGAKLSPTVGLCLSISSLPAQASSGQGISGLSFPICEMGHTMASPGGGVGRCLGIVRRGSMCLPVSPTISSIFFMFLSIPVSISVSALPPGLTHQFLKSTPPPGPHCTAGDTVWGHRVLVPTVPGPEHCLFVPMALTSRPAGRLTRAGPAGPRDRDPQKRGLLSAHLGLSFPRCSPPAETLPLLLSPTGLREHFFFF